MRWPAQEGGNFDVRYLTAGRRVRLCLTEATPDAGARSGGHPGHQLCFAGLKPLRHRFDFVLPEIVACTAEPCAFFFVNVMLHELAQHLELSRPLFARFVALGG